MAFYNIFESSSNMDYNDYCIDESTITMPLYNNRYSSISDMYEVACQLEIDGNDLIHEMEMNILMNEHNYFVEHGRSVQYSDRYGYLTEEGNSVWRFIQKMWETLMKYLDDCVSWVIDKCKEYIIYFKQAWAKWGMKEGLKGAIKTIEKQLQQLKDKNVEYEKDESMGINARTLAIADIFIKELGVKLDISEEFEKLEDEYKKIDSIRKPGAAAGVVLPGVREKFQKAKEELTNRKDAASVYQFKPTVDNIKSLLDAIKKRIDDGDTINDIKEDFKDRNDLSDIDGEAKILLRVSNKDNQTLVGLQIITYMANTLYSIMNKDISELLGKVFTEIRKRKKEVRENRISNRENDSDDEEFKKMKTLIKAYNAVASYTMKIFSRGISACVTIIRWASGHLNAIKASLQEELDKHK